MSLMEGKKFRTVVAPRFGPKTMGLIPSAHHLSEPEIVGPWPKTMDWRLGLGANKYNFCLGQANKYNCWAQQEELNFLCYLQAGIN